MTNNLVTIQDNRAITTSLKIAEIFDKPHHNVLRDIRNLKIPDDFRKLNFDELEYSYKNAINRTVKYPMFNISRDGFTLLAMGFTGKKAMQFKLAYIEAFNKMEKILKNNKPQLPKAELDMKALGGLVKRCTAVAIRDEIENIRSLPRPKPEESSLGLFEKAYADETCKKILVQHITHEAVTVSDVMKSIKFLQKEFSRTAKEYQERTRNIPFDLIFAERVMNLGYESLQKCTSLSNAVIN
jgi:Rha family phage regulatory protein